MIATNLAIPDLSFSVEIPHFGGSGCAMVAAAASAIVSGAATVVVCIRAIDAKAFQHAMRGPDRVRPFYLDSGDFLRPFGWSHAFFRHAVSLKRHMHEYGTTSEQIGRVIVAEREYGALNPRAMIRTPVTIEDYLHSEWFIEPLRELDMTPFNNDGACAVVVTSAKRAKDLKQRPAYIMAAVQSSGPYTQAWYEFPATIAYETAARTTAERLFRIANVTPQDIDVAEMYDCCSWEVLNMLEDYGFCERGGCGPFVAAGGIELGGRLPTNTHGGHLAEAYLHGVNHILEAVRQIRGTSSAQVKDAELAFVASAALPWPTSALILRR